MVDLFKEVADKVRDLFMIDNETRDAFGGETYSEDIRAELFQHGALAVDPNLYTKRKRVRLGSVVCSDEDALPIAYIGFTLMKNAQPTEYERTYMYSGRYPLVAAEEQKGKRKKAAKRKFVPQSGIFIRRLVVHPKHRRSGLALHLLEKVKASEHRGELPIFCDTKADNVAMRRLARKAGGAESSFWYTPGGTLMVRYLIR